MQIYQGDDLITSFSLPKAPLDQKETLAKEMVEKSREYLEKQSLDK